MNMVLNIGLVDDITKRKGLSYREDILDNMGSDELIANLIRIEIVLVVKMKQIELIIL